MMKNARPMDPQTLAAFEQRYAQSQVLKVSTHALYKNELNAVASVMPQNGDATYHFSIEIPTLPVTSQKRSGRCWIFAGLNLLRERVAKKCNLKEFELSQNYTAFWDKFEKCNWLLECMIDLAEEEADERNVCFLMQGGISDGGQWDMLVSVFEKYGVVPKEAMPETESSGNTGVLNRVLNTRLTRAVAEIRAAHGSGASVQAIGDIKQAAMSDVYNILCCCYGTPPKAFDFEYTDKDDKYHIERGLNPLSFMDQYVGIQLSDYVSIIHSPTADKPYNRSYTVDYLGNVVGGQPIRYLNLPMEEMKSLILQTLKKGEVVWFGSDVAHYGDRQPGVWDEKVFDYESLFETKLGVSKTDALDLRLSAMNHAMLITGVTLDPQEDPVKWKIENSWGDEAGDKGYYIMAASWFDRFVYQAVIHKDLLSAAQKEALAGDPIHLHPWDPMGTLAICE